MEERRLLFRGKSGDDVKELQTMLKAIVNAWDLVIDGIFGRVTERCLKQFQLSVKLLPDGIYGPQSRVALLKEYGSAPISNSDEKYRKRLMDLIRTMQSSGVVYGPGRGLFDSVASEWLVTWGPGCKERKDWKSIDSRNKKGPSFHCSSLVNFVLSYMINRNDKYTHAGNCPTLFKLVDMDSGLHPVDPTGVKSREQFRGFAGRLLRLASDGDTALRSGRNINIANQYKYLDYEEITERFDELGTLTVWSQSTREPIRAAHWKLDHHTGFFVKVGGRLMRFASDGYASKSGYSCQPIVYSPFVSTRQESLYQLFRVDLTEPLESTNEYPIGIEE